MLKEGKVSSEASLEMWNWLFAASDPRALLALPVSIPREQHTGTNFYHPNTEGLTREITGILKSGLVGVTLELRSGCGEGCRCQTCPAPLSLRVHGGEEKSNKLCWNKRTQERQMLFLSSLLTSSVSVSCTEHESQFLAFSHGADPMGAMTSAWRSWAVGPGLLGQGQAWTGAAAVTAASWNLVLSPPQLSCAAIPEPC